MKTKIQISADAGQCLVRSTASQRQVLERLLYHRYPGREWGTFFRFGYRRTRWGLLICWVDLLPPKEGDLDRRSGIVEFSPGYVRRALRAFDGTELGVGVIHSHPENCRPSPSSLDDDMDGYFAEEFERYGNGRPYVSLIIARDAYGRRVFGGRAFDKGSWLPVQEWLVAGDDVLSRETAVSSADHDYDPEQDFARERMKELVGGDVVARLRGGMVGIVGCSGLGSPAGHILARAGIGDFVLVDRGRFKRSNHERNHASRATDLRGEPMWKVDMLRRLIAEIDPATRATTIAGDILDEATLDELVRCDLLLGCTDSVYARAALGILATHYLVPVIDLAVQMRAEDCLLKEQIGEIAQYAPALPCPWCRGRVQASEIREETMTDDEKRRAQNAAREARLRGDDAEQYWTGGGHDLTVGYMTTALAAIGAGYAQQWLGGTGRMPHDRFQFDLGLREFGFVKDQRQPMPDCSCQRTVGFADQGRADRSVSKPPHWAGAVVTSRDEKPPARDRYC